jgi:UDP-glucose 4-epimerase
MNTKQIILVTGGAGYIGSHTLIELLKNPFYEVISLDNYSNSSSKTCSAYGNIKQLPVTEETPFQKAESPYAYTKVVGERILEDYTHANQNTRAISLRYFNPVGAHLSGLIGEDQRNPPTNLIPLITQTAIGKRKSFTVFGTDYNTRDGSCIRDYVHVSDIANAHVLALQYLETTKNRYDVFNLGTGNGVSVLEAIAAFKQVSGIMPQHILGARREGDVESIYSDCGEVKKALNWTAKYSLNEMMESAWKWEQQLQLEKEKV